MKFKKVQPEYILAAAYLLFLILPNIFIVYRSDILAAISLMLLVIFLLIIGISKKSPQWKILFISTSIFIFIKAVLLPIMFVYPINNANYEIIIDPVIENYERTSELRKLDEFFKTADTNSINSLRNILNANNPILNRTIPWPKIFFGKINPLHIDTFIIQEERSYKIFGRAKRVFHLAGKSGNNITSFAILYPTKPPGMLSDVNDRSLRYIIQRAIDRLVDLKQKTDIRRQELERNNMIWTYSMILPYVAFNSEAMKFQTPLTISIHGLSNIICDALLLAIIGTVVYETLLSKKSPNKKIE